MDGKKRRRHARIDQESKVIFTQLKGPAGSSLQATANNISAGGIFIKTKTKLPLDTRLEMRLSVPSRFLEVEATGRVAWISSKRGEEGLGVEFEEIDSVAKYDLMRGAQEGGWIYALGVVGNEK